MLHYHRILSKWTKNTILKPLSLYRIAGIVVETSGKGYDLPLINLSSRDVSSKSRRMLDIDKLFFTSKTKLSMQ